jgi:hypothetical protein
VFHRGGHAESEFREWLTQMDAEIEAVPHGTFMDPTLLATTGAASRLVCLRKPFS